MKIEDLKGKKVTVFGLGLHGGGVSMVKFLARNGAKIIVTDLKDKEQLAPSLEKLATIKGITYVLGQHRKEDFSQVDLVVKSPAVPWKNVYVRTALEHNIPVESDSSLFFRFCKNPIIGVTGTKGKTTISLLITHILHIIGEDSVPVGIGQIPVMDALRNITKFSCPVFELSSWRLSALKRSGVHKSPHIAVFKNFFADHLNYYKTMDEYLEDKKNIFRYQKKSDWCILNYDDAIVRNLEREVPSQVVWFGFSRPQKGRCVFVREGWIVFRDGEGNEERIVKTKDLGMKGKHNIVNTMGALGACWVWGVSVEKLKKHTWKLEGVPHRLEMVGEVGGVKYYNDTTATIPEATISALHSFTQPVFLIAGGSNKGLHYEGFAKSISHRTKGIVFLKGTATLDMQKALKGVLGEEAQKFPIVDSMKEAMEYAKSHTKSGDVVLLSPGAASFGMFDNEFDRGDQFRRLVKEMG
jgi:UDP-N-acetylmuramoylalanine--D-glutamate ligase